MSRKPTTVTLRRATPLDTINILKLLVDEERSAGTDFAFDEAGRVAHILQVIATGYAVVAEKSGRLVGTLGFSAGGPVYCPKKILTSDWYFLVPALQNSKLPAALLRKAVEFADEHKVAMTFSGLPVGQAGPLSEALVTEGFLSPYVTVTRGAKDEQEESAADADGTDGKEDSDPTEPV